MSSPPSSPKPGLSKKFNMHVGPTLHVLSRWQMYDYCQLTCGLLILCFTLFIPPGLSPSLFLQNLVSFNYYLSDRESYPIRMQQLLSSVLWPSVCGYLGSAVGKSNPTGWTWRSSVGGSGNTDIHCSNKNTMCWAVCTLSQLCIQGLLEHFLPQQLGKAHIISFQPVGRLCTWEYQSLSRDTTGYIWLQ